MNVILITGVSGAGKDTFAELLKSNLEGFGRKVQILHNSDSAKALVANYFGVTDYKTNEGKDLIMTITRMLYDIFENYFEDELEDFIEEDTDDLIIPDWRYMETYNYFDLSDDVYTVMITRKESNDYSIEIKNKESKLLKQLNPLLAPMIQIDNDGSIEDLNRKACLLSSIISKEMKR